MFNDLLYRCNSGPGHIKGIVNDAAIALGGPNIYTPIEYGQEAISRALEFGYENGFEFRPTRQKWLVVFIHNSQVGLAYYTTHA